jgi:hypothetical protein
VKNPISVFQIKKKSEEFNLEAGGESWYRQVFLTSIIPPQYFVNQSDAGMKGGQRLYYKQVIDQKTAKLCSHSIFTVKNNFSAE